MPPLYPPRPGRLPWLYLVARDDLRGRPHGGVQVGAGAAREALAGTAVSGAAAGFVPSGEVGSLLAGADGLECVRIALGPGTDLHAPMGATERGPTIRSHSSQS